MTPRMAGVAGVAALGALLAMALSAGCSDGGDAGVRVGSSSESPTPAAVTVDDRADIEACPTSSMSRGGAAESGLPNLELACLGPGDDVNVADLRGPMLVNVWASWCQPCRQELPWLQSVHDNGAVEVVGVDAEDRSDAAGALLNDLDVTFPSVFDPGDEFSEAMGVVGKPTTLFVDEAGEVVFVHPGPFTTSDELSDLLEAHLGISVP